MDDILRNYVNGKKVRIQVYAPEFSGFDGYDQLAQLDHSVWFKVAGGDTPQDSLENYVSEPSNLSRMAHCVLATYGMCPSSDVPKL